MRELSCEPGMKSCERLLHKWFYRDREGEGGSKYRFQAEEEDNENEGG
jgi:hypothetical protein